MYSISEVVQYTQEHFDEAVDAVCHYLRIPAISCDPEHFSDVRRLAAEIRDDLEAIGLQNSRVLELDNALPSVAAEWLNAGEDKPTVLIYGHLDIQPVKGEVWLLRHTNPPFGMAAFMAEARQTIWADGVPYCCVEGVVCQKRWASM